MDGCTDDADGVRIHHINIKDQKNGTCANDSYAQRSLRHREHNSVCLRNV